MFVPPLPLEWLIHSVTYTALGEDDGWGNTTESTTITIDHVRFDNTTTFSRDSNQNKVQAEAVVFVCTKHSTDVPDAFVEGAKITFNERDYTIKKIVDCYYPTTNKIHHYELEVV